MGLDRGTLEQVMPFPLKMFRFLVGCCLFNEPISCYSGNKVAVCDCNYVHTAERAPKHESPTFLCEKECSSL